MKRILTAIARALRTSVSFVWDRCAKTGAWTLRAIAGDGGAAPAPAAEADVSADRGTIEDLIQPDDGSVERLLERSKRLLGDIGETMLGEYSYGDDYDRLKRICADRNAGIEPYYFDEVSTWCSGVPSRMTCPRATRYMPAARARSRSRITIPTPSLEAAHDRRQAW